MKDTRILALPHVGSVVEVDGFVLPNQRRITFDHKVDEVPTVTVEVLAVQSQPGEIYRGPADVRVEIFLPEGFSLLDITHQDVDGKRFMIVSAKEAECPPSPNPSPSTSPTPAESSSADTARATSKSDPASTPTPDSPDCPAEQLWGQGT